jgi:two-component system chemotaxis response regulator CheB
MRLPRHVGRSPEPATLVCPDCGGVLSVRAEGDANYLLFVCQVGHSYSATTLLFAKEERLEEVLWSGVYLLEELAALLDDLAVRGGPDGRTPDWPAGRRRLHRLRDQAERLRQVLDGNEPVDLGAGAVSERDTA